MSEYLLIGCIVLLIIFIIWLTFKCKELLRDRRYYQDNYNKYHNAYWQLRQSDAVDRENYEIHIPWLTYDDDAIRKKQ